MYLTTSLVSAVESSNLIEAISYEGDSEEVVAGNTRHGHDSDCYMLWRDRIWEVVAPTVDYHIETVSHALCLCLFRLKRPAGEVGYSVRSQSLKWLWR